MIVLWLATAILCKQGQADEPVRGGPRNSGILHYMAHRPAPKSLAVEVTPDPVQPETTQKARFPVDIDALVEYHAGKAAEASVRKSPSPIAVAVKQQIYIDPAILEAERLFQFQLQVLYLQEVEYAEAAEAAFAWLMQET